MSNASLDKTALVRSVLAAMREVVGDGAVALHEPELGGSELACLKDCLDSGYVSTAGAMLSRFESALADYTGAGHVIATINGTAALHLALLVAGVEPNDEVLLPTLSFVATANAVRYCGALPHFVDSEPRTLGVDAARLRDHLARHSAQSLGRCVNRKTGRVIRALVPMHCFGHPCDMDSLTALAEEFRLVVVEDAAEALGSLYQGRQVGCLGKAGILSFNGNKTITTGGGGALLTHDAQLAQRARHLASCARVAHDWEYRHDEVGFNYRMPSLNAALGCAQLQRLPQLLAQQRTVHQRYQRAFAGVEGVTLFTEAAGCRSNYWLQTLLLAPAHADLRDVLLATSNGAGLATRPCWTLLHKLRPFSSCPRMELTGALDLERRVINLPSSARLAQEAA